MLHWLSSCRRSEASFRRLQKPCVRTGLPSARLPVSQSFHWKSILGGSSNPIGNNRVFHCSFHCGIWGGGGVEGVLVKGPPPTLSAGLSHFWVSCWDENFLRHFRGSIEEGLPRLCVCVGGNLVLWCIIIISRFIGCEACKNSLYMAARCFWCWISSLKITFKKQKKLWNAWKIFTTHENLDARGRLGSWQSWHSYLSVLLVSFGIKTQIQDNFFCLIRKIHIYSPTYVAVLLPSIQKQAVCRAI